MSSKEDDIRHSTEPFDEMPAITWCEPRRRNANFSFGFFASSGGRYEF
jgi:hypothetical protein